MAIAAPPLRVVRIRFREQPEPFKRGVEIASQLQRIERLIEPLELGAFGRRQDACGA